MGERSVGGVGAVCSLRVLRSSWCVGCSWGRGAVVLWCVVQTDSGKVALAVESGPADALRPKIPRKNSLTTFGSWQSTRAGATRAWATPCLRGWIRAGGSPLYQWQLSRHFTPGYALGQLHVCPCKPLHLAAARWGEGQLQAVPRCKLSAAWRMHDEVGCHSQKLPEHPNLRQHT